MCHYSFFCVFFPCFYNVFLHFFYVFPILFLVIIIYLLRLDMSEKSRRNAESDLHEATNKIGELSSLNSNYFSQKKKLVGEILVLQADLDESIIELKQYEERIRKSTDDAARLSEELRNEQVRKIKFFNNKGSSKYDFFRASSKISSSSLYSILLN